MPCFSLNSRQRNQLEINSVTVVARIFTLTNLLSYKFYGQGITDSIWVMYLSATMLEPHLSVKKSRNLAKKTREHSLKICEVFRAVQTGRKCIRFQQAITGYPRENIGGKIVFCICTSHTLRTLKNPQIGNVCVENTLTKETHKSVKRPCTGKLE